MKVTLQYFDSCPNWRITDRRIRGIIETHDLDIDLSHQLIESPEAAETYRFHGSPSILIDGVDPFATEAPRSGSPVACTSPTLVPQKHHQSNRLPELSACGTRTDRTARTSGRADVYDHLTAAAPNCRQREAHGQPGDSSR